MKPTATVSKIRIKFAIVFGLYLVIHLSAYVLQELEIDHPFRSWAIVPLAVLLLYGFFMRCEKCGQSFALLFMQTLGGSAKKYHQNLAKFIFQKNCPVCQLERK